MVRNGSWAMVKGKDGRSNTVTVNVKARKAQEPRHLVFSVSLTFFLVIN